MKLSHTIVSTDFREAAAVIATIVYTRWPAANRGVTTLSRLREINSENAHEQKFRYWIIETTKLFGKKIGQCISSCVRAGIKNSRRRKPTKKSILRWNMSERRNTERHRAYLRNTLSRLQKIPTAIGLDLCLNITDQTRNHQRTLNYYKTKRCIRLNFFFLYKRYEHFWVSSI